jgi:hypothetical protein
VVSISYVSIFRRKTLFLLRKVIIFSNSCLPTLQISFVMSISSRFASVSLQCHLMWSMVRYTAQKEHSRLSSLSITAQLVALIFLVRKRSRLFIVLDSFSAALYMCSAVLWRETNFQELLSGYKLLYITLLVWSIISFYTIICCTPKRKS